MPYIKDADKDFLAPLTDAIHADKIRNAGELNYIITTIVQHYFAAEGRRNYQAINDVIGALDGAKAEFQRRVVGPYEDMKIAQNGDVLHPDIAALLKDVANKRY